MKLLLLQAGKTNPLGKSAPSQSQQNKTIPFLIQRSKLQSQPKSKFNQKSKQYLKQKGINLRELLQNAIDTLQTSTTISQKQKTQQKIKQIKQNKQTECIEISSDEETSEKNLPLNETIPQKTAISQNAIIPEELLVPTGTFKSPNDTTQLQRRAIFKVIESQKNHNMRTKSNETNSCSCHEKFKLFCKCSK